MITGRQTLGSIEGAVQQQTAKVRDVELRLDGLRERLLALQAEQLKDYRELAKHRANDLAARRAGKRVLGYLDDGEQQVKQLMLQRQQAQSALEQEIEQIEQQHNKLATERSAQEDVIERLDQQIDDVEADIQQQLEADTAYRSQQERTGQADRIARHAREKATRSAEERHNKGAAYEADELFNYLYRRHFGTGEYHANALIKALDKWVAGLIGYNDARINYQRLLELPQRLDEHAKRKEEEAEAQFQSLKKLDDEALKAGGASSLENEQKGEQEALAEIDQRIEETDRRYQELLKQRARYAAGEDESFQSAIRLMSSEIADEDLRGLREDALATPYPEDDIIVERLLDAEEDRESLQRQSHRLKSLLNEHQDRLQELEVTSREFKAKHYDHPRSGFSDGALVGAVLGEILTGAMKSDSLWDVLTEQQQPRQL